MKRSQARELAFVLMFELSFHEDSPYSDIVEAAKLCRDLDLDDFAYALASKAWNNRQTIDQTITQHLDKWKLERISRVSLAILRTAICEIENNDDVPVSVSINEAVELAKKYGSDEDPAFVNGLLGSLVRKNDAAPAQA